MPIENPEERAAYNRAWRAKRKQQGMCTCGKPIDDPLLHTYCQECREEQVKLTRKRRMRNRRSKRCAACGELTGSKRITCRKCIQKTKDTQQRYRAACLSAYGEKCACCGEAEIRFLCIDHINNDGKEHRKVVGSGQLTTWLCKHNFPKGFQTLCFNCNQGKHLNGGICPHKA